MKMKKLKFKTTTRKVHSLADLYSEKSRLKGELRKTEENISSNYHHLRESFKLQNILRMVTHDIEMTTSAFSKAFSIGKSLLGKVKKKKKKDHDEETGEH
jgi:hypothetical protein